MTVDRDSNTVPGTTHPSENVSPVEVVADGAVTPGTQLVITGRVSDTSETLFTAEAGSNDRPTYRVATSKRHPPSGEEGRSPSLIGDDYEDGEHVEYVVFNAGYTADNLLLADGEDTTGEIGTEFVFDADGEVAVYDDGTHDASDIAGEILSEADNDASDEDRVEVMFK